jgi:hypothetical protein
VSLVRLAVPASNLRLRSMAFIRSTGETVVRLRRTPTAADPTVDPVAFVYHADGTLARTIDLHASVNAVSFRVKYLAFSDELLFDVIDDLGARRLVVTDVAGDPRRSYRAGELKDAFDFAPINSGPNAGQLGAIFAGDSQFVRFSLP